MKSYDSSLSHLSEIHGQLQFYVYIFWSSPMIEKIFKIKIL